MTTHSIIVRSARFTDATGMTNVINPLIELGGSTAHRTVFGVERMQNHYIAGPSGFACTVAVEGAEIIGFQSLARPNPRADDENTFPDGWAIIASFVALGHHGTGVGQLLFPATLAAARAAHITNIDATIRQENTGGQAYYEKVGFITYSENSQTVSKKFTV